MIPFKKDVKEKSLRPEIFRITNPYEMYQMEYYIKWIFDLKYRLGASDVSWIYGNGSSIQKVSSTHAIGALLRVF